MLFNQEVEGRAEIRWIEAWHHHGIRLLPDPVAPASELVVVENFDDSNLLINNDFYSSFLCDDISRAQAKLVSSLNYSSVASASSCLSDKNNNIQKLTVPLAFLSSSSSTDVLGLMHERTGHANKRSLIECVKSSLVTGLQIEEKHIRKYKSDDRHVCDVCARAKLTRTSFKKIHTIRGAALGDYISVDIAVFVNCESREG